jgi:adenylate cyclase
MGFSLRATILALAAALIVLLAGFAAIALSRISDIRDDLEQLGQYVLPIDRTLVQIAQASAERKLTAIRAAEPAMTPAQARVDLARLHEVNAAIAGHVAEISGWAAAIAPRHDLPAGTALRDQILAIARDVEERRAAYEHAAAALATAIDGGEAAALDQARAGLHGLADARGVRLDHYEGLLNRTADDVLAHVRREETVLLAVALALLAAAAALALLLAMRVDRRLVRPVQLLASAAGDIERGRLDVIVPERGRDEVGRLSAAFNRMAEGLRTKERIKETFGRYIDRRVVEELVRDGAAALATERRSMTVAFANLAGFTSLAEGMAPERLVSFLNTYLGEMTSAVAEQQGVVDKIIGDAVMSFYGPPFVPAAEQGSRACQAALAQIARLAEVERLVLPERGLRLRLGIATGDLVVGSIGSDLARSYTVIGDPVNVAAGLEEANKHYGTWALADEATVRLASDEIEARELDIVTLPGKSQPTRVYEVLARRGALDDKRARLRSAYAVALAAYRARDWAAAIRGFEECLRIEPADQASQAMLQRIDLYAIEPPEAGWTGIWSLTDA